MRLLPLAGVFVAALASAASAEATTKIEFNTGQQPLRTPTNDRLFDGKAQGAVINRNDCEAGGGMQFTLASNFRSRWPTMQYLQVWTRTDSSLNTTCAPSESRYGIAGSGSTPLCRLVIQYSVSELVKSNGVFVIPDRNIIAAAYKKIDTYTGTPTGTGYTAKELTTTEACTPNGPMIVGYGPTVTANLQLSFLPLDSTGVAGGEDGGELTWTGVYDMAGPEAPSSLSLTGGNQQLFATFTSDSSDTSLLGYTVYCVKTSRKWGSAAPTVDTGVPSEGGATDTAEAATDTAEAASDADETGAADTAGDTGSDTGTATDTGSSSAGTSATCGDPSGLLVEGAYPTKALDSYVCGTANQALSSSKVQMTGLDNDYYYAVAVSGRDVHGNTGPLSVIGCEAPGATLDFWERYREAGGQGGGGYCAYGHGPAGAASVVAVLAALSFAGRRAQRKR